LFFFIVANGSDPSCAPWLPPLPPPLPPPQPATDRHSNIIQDVSFDLCNETSSGSAVMYRLNILAKVELGAKAFFRLHAVSGSRCRCD
jgi:hypothetical protein